jgi:hypothetical protein
VGSVIDGNDGNDVTVDDVTVDDPAELLDDEAAGSKQHG